MGSSYNFGVPGASDSFVVDSLGVGVSAPASVGTIATAPPASASVAVTVGTPVHNTLGYDAALMVTLDVTAATSATISAGVGPTSSPAVWPVATSESLTGVTSMTMYVPSGYYALVSTSGTISETATGIWFPI